MEKVGKARVKSVNDELNKGDYVLLKNFDTYNLGYNNGEFIEILREKMVIPKSPKEVELEKIAIAEEEKLKKLIVEEQKEVDVFQKKIENAEIERMEGFKEFKKEHNLPLEWTFDFFTKELPEGVEHFENFLIERNGSQDEYLDFDEGDY